MKGKKEIKEEIKDPGRKIIRLMPPSPKSIINSLFFPAQYHPQNKHLKKRERECGISKVQYKEASGPYSPTNTKLAI